MRRRILPPPGALRVERSIITPTQPAGVTPPGHGGTPPGHGGTVPGRSVIPPGQVPSGGVIAVGADPSSVVALGSLSGGTVPHGGGGLATPAFVQGTMPGHGVGNTVSFVSNVVAGNLLVAYGNISPNGATTITSVTDNLGNTYAQAGALQNGWFTSFLGIWYVISAASGACTVTFNFSGAGFLQFTGLGVHEVSGIAALTPLRATAFGHVFPATTGTNNTTVGPVNVGVNDYVFAYVGDDDSGNFSAGTAFNARTRQEQGSTANGMQTEDTVSASSGTTNGVFTLTTGDHIDLGVATFKAATL